MHHVTNSFIFRTGLKVIYPRNSPYKLTFDLFFVSFLLAVDDIVDDILGDGSGDVLGKSFHRFKAINGMFA